MGIFRGEGGTGDSNTDATVTAVTEQATIATTKASEAAASAAEASTSAANSAASASSSSNSSAAAATSATQAATSATASAASATASASSAASAATAQANAETAETNAETAETNAAASATTATTKASEAATSATSASTSASTATTKASEAATSASNAATSETNAATSASTATTKASEASTSASNAATSEANAAASYDDFDDRYLGAKSSAPSTDNDGDALVTGALYFDTSSNAMKVYSGSAWLDAYASLSGALIATNNLSDLNNVGTARTNLGLGTAATTASTDYATAAQGTTADNALPKSGGAMTGAITTNSTFDGRDVSADGTKLDGIEAGATADQTAAEIKTAYESNADTNAFTDADHTKLDGIEASADVTDTTNVVAALSAGTGISLSVGGVIANTSPDQTVSLTGAGATSISGTYPNFTITSTDNNTTYTAGTGITLTGTEFSLTDTNAKLNVSDYTAADVLTKIKTVDGSGSGLDADTVDGIHATNIVESSNAITSNLDTFYDAQMFGWTTTTTGKPTDGYGQGIGIVSNGKTHNNSNNWITQLGFGTSENSAYFRSKTNSGSWGAWKTFWHSGNDGSGSGLDADTVDGIQASSFLQLSGGTMSGTLNFNNNNITNVNHLTFNDSGVNEGLQWLGGSDWRIFESPDNLTNASGNLQFTTGGTRRMTLNTSGSAWTQAQGTLWGSSNDGSGSGLDADTVDGKQVSQLYRLVGSANGTAGAGWITVAQCTSSRYHGEVFVTDGESGDHSFIRIDWMRSYADTSFTVLNCGGHANRITGVRVLNETSNTTYGTKKLQVYVTTSSNYFVRIHSTGEVSHYGDFTAVTPVVQNTISGYNVQGATIDDLDDYTLATHQGLRAGNGCDIKWNTTNTGSKARFINEGGTTDTWLGLGGYNGLNILYSGYGYSGGLADLAINSGTAGELARVTTGKRIGINNSSPAYYVDTTFPNTNSTQQHWRFTGTYGGSQCRSYYGSLFIGSSYTTGHGIAISNSGIWPAEADNSSFNNDNVMDLGYASSRWDDVYATNGTIQTSDEREKQDIEALSDAEQRVAVAAKGLLRKFRWKDAVEEKGDNARTHFGIIAQDLQAAFEAEGLDHSKYAMFIKSEWWIGDKTHPAIDDVLDDEGNVIVEGSPEHVETDHHYDNEADAPSDATYHYRLGIRYSELLAFIISAI